MGLLNAIKRFFGIEKTEYVYYFSLQSIVFNPQEETKAENLRTLIIQFIQEDALKESKEIKFSDYMLDSKLYNTHFVFATDSIKTNQYLIPVMYELYAFKKIQKEEIFTYQFKNLIFKKEKQEVKVLKFAIKC